MRALSKSLVVTDAIYAPLGKPLPLHWIFLDRTGDCAVLECDQGTFLVHDNPFGVFTNAPSFPKLASMTESRLGDWAPFLMLMSPDTSWVTGAGRSGCLAT